MNPSVTTRFRLWLAALALAAAVGPTTIAAAAEPDAPRVTGPYTHENLTVFLVHAAKQDGRDFITLDEGLKAGLVTVSEKEQAQVRELQIENRGDRPLFLQEGDRLKGGKQDRTIYSSLVVPPHSGKVGVPTFCIEPGRWQPQGGQGAAFGVTLNAALAPKEVRQAAKFSKDQQEVWDAVGEQKRQAGADMLAPSATTSLNELFDAPKVRELSDAFAKALADVPRKHADAVGVAVAVNGKIEEVDVYPNHALLAKLYPRLLQSYALQATLAKGRAKDGKPVTPAAVAEFLAEAKKKPERDEAVNADNRLRLAVSGKAGYATTFYQGAAVHQQVLRLSPPAPRSGGGPAANPAPQPQRPTAPPNDRPKR